VRRLGPQRRSNVSAEERCLSTLDLNGRTVFDVGGFVGDHTLFFADRVGPTGRVLTFEPHPENCATILARVARAQFANVDVRQAAVGSQIGSLEFVYPDDRGLGSADPQIKSRLLRELGGVRLSFPVKVLDREIEAGRVPEPDFVKIDVEGWEYDVLVGMDETARRGKPVIFVELHAANDAQEIANYRRVITWLVDHRYVVKHVESGRTLRSANDASECYAGQHLLCE
jgi:FkbM family methyltransferase